MQKNVVKIQYKLRVISGLNSSWYGSMECNMEENFSMEWNMEWKIFSMEWKWNGRKLPVCNMEKSFSIPFHALPKTKQPAALYSRRFEPPSYHK